MFASCCSSCWFCSFVLFVLFILFVSFALFSLCLLCLLCLLDQHQDRIRTERLAEQISHNMFMARAFVVSFGCFAVADDVNAVIADMGDALGAQVVNDLEASQSVLSSSDIMKSMSRLPPPASPFIAQKLDPGHDDVAEMCDRDFTLDCPQHFVSIGPIRGGSTAYCAADSTYAGPCDSDVYNFDAYSRSAKARWSNMCLANWPCVECERDYQSPCPREWIRASGARVCSPPSHYTGPCSGAVDFAFFNKAMLAEWSSRCAGYWECSHAVL